jgi:16S rRNA (uracil1498-N3)-methyltransferase
MTRRYYAPDLPRDGGPIRLSKPETHHAVRVMRVREGDKIVIFDGIGHEAAATISQVSRDECWCLCEPSEMVDRESRVALDLGISLPKPDRARGLIERLTELGVRSVTPLVCRHTQRCPSPALLDKLKLVAIEASKQCGRNCLLSVRPASSLPSFIDGSSAEREKWIADRCGDRLALRRSDRGHHAVVAMIGPEGGWSSDELERSRQGGFTVMGLGRRTLRIETAATMVAALVADG